MAFIVVVVRATIFCTDIYACHALLATTVVTVIRTNIMCAGSSATLRVDRSVGARSFGAMYTVPLAATHQYSSASTNPLRHRPTMRRPNSTAFGLFNNSSRYVCVCVHVCVHIMVVTTSAHDTRKVVAGPSASADTECHSLPFMLLFAYRSHSVFSATPVAKLCTRLTRYALHVRRLGCLCRVCGRSDPFGDIVSRAPSRLWPSRHICVHSWYNISHAGSPTVHASSDAVTSFMSTLTSNYSRSISAW